MIDPISLWLLTAHLVGDFPLQPDWMAEKKAWVHNTEDSSIKGISTLLIHVLIHGFLVSIIAYYTLPISAILPFVLWIAGTHFIIDSNRWVEPKEGWGESWVWLNDQIMHLVALSLAYPIVFLL